MSRQKVEGSHKVASWIYHEAAECLEIEYVWGSVVRYWKVSPTLAKSFEMAESKGSFLSAHIERRLPWAKLQPGEDERAPWPGQIPEFVPPAPRANKKESAAKAKPARRVKLL